MVKKSQLNCLENVSAHPLCVRMTGVEVTSGDYVSVLCKHYTALTISPSPLYTELRLRSNVCPLIPCIGDQVTTSGVCISMSGRVCFKIYSVVKVQNKAVANNSQLAENILLTLESHDLMINLGGRMSGGGRKICKTHFYIVSRVSKIKH